MLSVEDTICAIATAAGSSVRGIVRLSGPHTHSVLNRCFSPLRDVSSPTLIQGQFQFDTSGGARSGSLPVDLFLWPDERSYTRQQTAELHTFGSPPLLNAIVRALCAHGARPAEPGEFTLRAFLAGRIDLTQAEAVIGVIGASGKRMFEVALRQLAGGFSKPLFELREQLLAVLAHLEAGLDFVEEDISFISSKELCETLEEAKQSVEQLLTQLRNRNVAREYPRVVLKGLPNVGKSSLFNAIVGSSASLVANMPGTTRDYVAAMAEICGTKCELIDTAGIETCLTQEPLTVAAQQQSNLQMSQADLTILCFDSTRPLLPEEHLWLLEAERDGTPPIVVLTKCDQPSDSQICFSAIRTSSRNGSGIDELCREIRRRLSESITEQAIVGTAERCQDSLAMTIESLQRALDLASRRLQEELVAAELRIALSELGKVVGVVYTDDILDRIFSRFCIGK